jgi:hypothetical protein
MPERHPGWVTGINDFEARLASGLLVTSQQTDDALDPLRVRSGIRDAPGNPGLVTLGTNTATVNPFQAVLQDPARPAQGAYLVTLDSAKALPLTAADPSLSRIDLVIAEIDATVDPGFVVRVVEGERNASPQPPTVTNPLHLKLAQIQIPAGTAASSFTDLRQFTAALGGILPVRGAADLPAAAAGSLFAFQLDTKRLLYRAGGQWTPYRPPRGSVDAWHEAGFGAGWTNYSDPTTGVFNTVAYTITEDGWVRLRGLAKATGSVASGATIFTLPATFRPRRQILCTVFSANGVIRADIKSAGAVTATSAFTVNEWVSLDNISFAAAATYTT